MRPVRRKGTQAELLVEALGIPSISTRNMLREAIANGTQIGKEAKHYMDNGLLVPDDVILGIVAERVAMADCAKGFILDGVPRTLAQAQALEDKGIRIDHVVSIEIDDAVIEGRMTGRRVCTKCGASYHIVANPTKVEGVCDLCGSAVSVRKDDTPDRSEASEGLPCGDRGAEGVLRQAGQPASGGGRSAHLQHHR